ncbi:hypothetical protein CR513_10465, partial [Mucuna pruriens]
MFAWLPKDMLGIDPIFFAIGYLLHLACGPCAKRRGEDWGTRRDKKQRKKRPSFCKRALYERLDILTVMVRKPSGKWRMCTNYTDVNKAYPKDLYPLPSIDGLGGWSVWMWSPKLHGCLLMVQPNRDASK